MNSPTWAEHGQPSIDSPNIELFRLDQRTNAGQSSCQSARSYIYTIIHTYIHTCMHTYIHTIIQSTCCCCQAPHRQSLCGRTLRGLLSLVVGQPIAQHDNIMDSRTCTGEHEQPNMGRTWTAKHWQPNIELFRLDKRTNTGQSSCLHVPFTWTQKAGLRSSQEEPFAQEDRSYLLHLVHLSRPDRQEECKRTSNNQ